MEMSGAVLAGGRSSRFGSDKARHVLNGKPLAGWVLGSFAEMDERFLVAGRPYPEFGVPVYPDLYQRGAALCGLHSALVHAQHSWVAVAACDLPFLSPAYWRALADVREGVLAVTVVREGRAEPLASLYHKALLDLAEARLRRGELALQGLLDARWTARLAWETLSLPPLSFENFNVPQGVAEGVTGLL